MNYLHIAPIMILASHYPSITTDARGSSGKGYAGTGDTNDGPMLQPLREDKG